MVTGLLVLILEMRTQVFSLLDPGSFQYIMLSCNLLLNESSYFIWGKIKPNDDHLPNNKDPKSSYIFLYVTQIKSYISIYQLLIWLLSNIPSYHREKMSQLSELGHGQN